jgi:hypothetical protein
LCYRDSKSNTFMETHIVVDIAELDSDECNIAAQHRVASLQSLSNHSQGRQKRPDRALPWFKRERSSLLLSSLKAVFFWKWWLFLKLDTECVILDSMVNRASSTNRWRGDAGSDKGS